MPLDAVLVCAPGYYAAVARRAPQRGWLFSRAMLARHHDAAITENHKET